MRARALRLGIVGLGKIAQLHHLPNVAANDRATVAFVADIDRAHCAAIIDRFGLQDAATIVDGRLPLDDIDALLVLNRHHAPWLCAAMDAKVPAFVEKPACWTLDEVAVLRALDVAQRTPVVVGYMKRYLPPVERLRRRLVASHATHRASVRCAAGGLEKLHRAHVKPLRPAGTPAEVRSEEQTLRGAEPGWADDAAFTTMRTVLEFGIHSIDLTTALLGRVTDVVAARSTGDGEVDIELRHTGGSSSIVLSPMFDEPRPWEDRITIEGPGAATILFSDPFSARGASSSTRADAHVGFSAELDHFLDVVERGDDVRTTLADALRDVEVAHRIVAAIDA